MKERSHRIFAISPGAREMGMAVLEGADPIYRGAEYFKSRRSPTDVLAGTRRKMLGLTADFRSATATVARSSFASNRNPALLDALADEAAAISEQNRLRVIQCAPRTAKEKIAGNDHASKAEAAGAIAARLPEL
ncbi:MAG: hypothetical protein ABSC23_11735 [Bryobacteraceae bacterium]|jgi:Holliday junction resolvasome RuvABC endonuclease subunit